MIIMHTLQHWLIVITEYQSYFSFSDNWLVSWELCSLSPHFYPALPFVAALSLRLLEGENLCRRSRRTTLELSRPRCRCCEHLSVVEHVSVPFAYWQLFVMWDVSPLPVHFLFVFFAVRHVFEAFCAHFWNAEHMRQRGGGVKSFSRRVEG